MLVLYYTLQRALPWVMPACDLYPAFKEPGVPKSYGVAAGIHFLQRQVRLDVQRSCRQRRECQSFTHEVQMHESQASDTWNLPPRRVHQAFQHARPVL